MPIRLRMKIAEVERKRNDSDNSEGRRRMRKIIRRHKSILMQFQTRANHPVDTADQHHQAGFEVAVQSNLVHAVQ